MSSRQPGSLTCRGPLPALLPAPAPAPGPLGLTPAQEWKAHWRSTRKTILPFLLGNKAVWQRPKVAASGTGGAAGRAIGQRPRCPAPAPRLCSEEGRAWGPGLGSGPGGPSTPPVGTPALVSAGDFPPTPTAVAVAAVGALACPRGGPQVSSFLSSARSAPLCMALHFWGGGCWEQSPRTPNWACGPRTHSAGTLIPALW